jgi:hypothetical protein
MDLAIAAIVAALGGVIRVPLTAALLLLEAMDIAAAAIGFDTGREIIASLRTLIVEVLEGFEIQIADSLKSGILNLIAEQSALVGFPLDPNEPFSAESITAAVNARLGTQFGDVTDQESVGAELKRIAAEKVSEETGIPIESIENPEEWANFAAALIVEGANNNLPFIQREYVCPALNTVLNEFCKTPECHECMDDYIDCLERREKAQRNRDRNKKTCTRSPK